MPISRPRIVRVTLALLMVFALSACGKFAAEADAKFGDQHFKTAIALIELYQVRHGSYPTALDQLDYIGDWDRIALAAVRYERLPDGYGLDLERGWVGKPDVVYPAEFWKGLGLRRTNVGHAPPVS